MNITEITNFEDKCTGCEACKNICPKNAIEMAPNYEGFLYPNVSSDCINCGKCVSVCQILNSNISKYMEENSYKTNIYWCYNKNEKIRIKSSSGGLFSEIATNIINDNGCVFGAALNTDLEVCHEAVEDLVELDKLVGSKYVQSRISTTYKMVKNNLDTGRTVLFCGTPCQISGLLCFLKKKYENLITIDFICHGVPSEKFFSEMISSFEKKYKSAVNAITFREKDNGWRKQTTKIYLKNDKIIKNKSINTFYYNAFLNNFSLRKSCFYCDYSQKHVSDITLGDFWGTNDVADKGESLLIINSTIGIKVFEKTKDSIVFGELSKERISACFQKRQDNDQYDIKKRNIFFEFLIKKGYFKTKRKYAFAMILKRKFSLFNIKINAYFNIKNFKKLPLKTKRVIYKIFKKDKT